MRIGRFFSEAGVEGEGTISVDAVVGPWYGMRFETRATIEVHLFFSFFVLRSLTLGA